MPCVHKFEKYLDLTKLDFEPTTLIIGTFNPAWPEGNKAEWFYGRTGSNYFWELLGGLYGDQGLINKEADDWKAFCKTHKIAITDILRSIKDADIENPVHIDHLKNYSDQKIATEFKDLDPVDITALLKQNPTIRNVYVTRTVTGLWKKYLQDAMAYCKANNIRFNSLLTPSGYSYFQYGRFKKNNPESTILQGAFVLGEWQKKWHTISTT